MPDSQKTPWLKCLPDRDQQQLALALTRRPGNSVVAHCLMKNMLAVFTYMDVKAIKRNRAAVRTRFAQRGPTPSVDDVASLIGL